jgi:hypothetical protein
VSPDQPPDGAALDHEDDPHQRRLNRNLDQLLEEVRVALPGVQVLFAFLLAVPFATRWDTVSRFERQVYFATLLTAAAASLCLIAPSMHHRLLFRHGDKEHLVQLGSRFAIAGLSLLALALTGALLLISDYLYGHAVGALVAGTALLLFGLLWYVLPLRRRRLLDERER